VKCEKIDLYSAEILRAQERLGSALRSLHDGAGVAFLLIDAAGRMLPVSGMIIAGGELLTGRNVTDPGAERLTWWHQIDNTMVLGGAAVMPFFKGAKALGKLLPPQGKMVLVKLEKHHLLPVQFKKFFERAGLDIEKYTIYITQADHRLAPNGLHTGSNNWNKVWDDFIKKQDGKATADEILQQLQTMCGNFGF